MHQYSNSKHHQLSLNINCSEYVLLDGLFTKRVRELIQIFTNKSVTVEYIHKQAGKGKLQLSYSYGTLNIVPSLKGKSGRFCRWDITFSPTSLKSLSH